jgi:hypothetical protein
MERFEFRQFSETETEIMEYDFRQAVEVHDLQEIETDFDESAVNSLRQQLAETQAFILGEMHGVKENPDVIYTLFKKFGFNNIALEWSERELGEVLKEFLVNNNLNFEDIKDSRDGRITAGHFALLKKLKEEDLLGKIILFDQDIDPNIRRDTSENERDLAMSQNVLSGLGEGNTLIIAGNWHTQVNPVTASDDTLKHPMGEHLKSRMPTIPFGNIRYQKGQYHNLGTRDFWTNPDIEPISKPTFRLSEDGKYLYTIPEAHSAIVPNMEEVEVG